MLTLTIILSSIVQLAVSFFIFKKGRTNLSYLLFLGLSIVTWAWALLNYLSVIIGNSTYLILTIRLIMMLAVVQIGLFYLFSKAFPDSLVKDYKKEILLFVCLTIFVASVAVSPYMFRSISLQNGIIETKTGPGIFIFIAYALFCIIGAFRVLLHKLHASNGLKRIQLVLILVAATLNWIIVPMTNFVLTLLLKSLLFVKLAPLYTLLFAGILAYALVNRRLFDTKTILKDSTIYVDQHLRSARNRTYQYYELQTLVYEAGTNHVALDFSGVKGLDKEAINLLKTLRTYMRKQGKTIYFVGYSQKVFNQLQPNKK